MKLEYTAQIQRGWPAQGSLEASETIKSGVTLVNGDVVAIQADGTVDKVGATPAGKVGLVIRGNGDSSSAKNVNKALVLWGNYIAAVSNAAAGAYAPGSDVTAANGVFALADGVDDPVVGFVKKVVAASDTETAHIVIVVN